MTLDPKLILALTEARAMAKEAQESAYVLTSDLIAGQLKQAPHPYVIATYIDDDEVTIVASVDPQGMVRYHPAPFNSESVKADSKDELLQCLEDLIEGNQLLPGYHYDQAIAAIAKAKGGAA